MNFTFLPKSLETAQSREKQRSILLTTRYFLELPANGSDAIL